MTRILVLSALLLACPASAKTLTVAVIDTGIDTSVGKLCKYSSKSFTDSSPKDEHGHGTHVAGLIVQNAGDNDYCLVSLKYYREQNTGKENLRHMLDAIRYAVDLKVDYINISGGGDVAVPEERALIKKALDAGIVVVAAAGNEHNDLDKLCNFFPACYDPRIVVVGNLEITKDFRDLNYEWRGLAKDAGLENLLGTVETRKAYGSNYGKVVNRWEIGTNVRSNIPSTLGFARYGYMSGTSQATAVATGKLIKLQFNKMKGTYAH